MSLNNNNNSSSRRKRTFPCCCEIISDLRDQLNAKRRCCDELIRQVNMLQDSLRRLVRAGPELERADDYDADAEDDDYQQTPVFVAPMDESESEPDSDPFSQSSNGEKGVVPIKRIGRYLIGDGLRTILSTSPRIAIKPSVGGPK
ncbi:hypothetical protein ON010_g15716 [Phytophthora cinnamomi]|nr:hypothetical protein ON010_g15716 [Phytophthora cinnamomi]